MNAINFKPQIRSVLKQARNSLPAKAFVTGCAVVGFRHGFNQSKVSCNDRPRLLTERLAWGALYSGIYTWGHPLVTYHLIRLAEVAFLETHYQRTYPEDYYPMYLSILAVPHAPSQVYKEK